MIRTTLLLTMAIAGVSQLSWAEEYQAPTVASAAASATVEVEPPALVAETPAPIIADRPEVHRGIASWYGPRFHGRRTASGEVYNMYALTAAHPFLPFGTLVRVRNLISGKIVDVRVNDRGPHVARRVIDLSKAAAAALGLHEPGGGTPPVAITVLQGTAAEERSSASNRLSRSFSRSQSPAVR